MTPCKFVFDDSPQFEGFSYGTKWNGFDNVAVTKETHAKIVEYFRQMGDDPDCLKEFEELPVDANGIVSYSHGYTTQIV